MSRAGFLITQIKHTQRRVFARLLEASGIDAFNGAQGNILYVLWEEEGMSSTVLAKRCGLAKTTLSAMLERMEAKGLVSRGVNPGNRREVLVHLTQQARSYAEAYERVSRQMDGLCWAGFSPKEVQTLEALLERMLENLGRAQEDGDSNA